MLTVMHAVVIRGGGGDAAEKGGGNKAFYQRGLCSFFSVIYLTSCSNNLRLALLFSQRVQEPV